MSGSGENSDLLNRIQQYRNMVLEYEALNDEISQLIMNNGGGSEHMSADDLTRYREMAHRRDELQHEIRWLEQQLLEDDQNDD